jgi:hypothetical protein
MVPFYHEGLLYKCRVAKNRLRLILIEVMGLQKDLTFIHEKPYTHDFTHALNRTAYPPIDFAISCRSNIYGDITYSAAS